MMKKTKCLSQLLFITSFFSLLGCRDKTQAGVASPQNIDAELYPEKPDGEFFRSMRKEPRIEVSVDFRKPKDFSGIPPVKWIELGGLSFCPIQGTVDTRITLPSGRVIQEEFGIVYVYRSDNRITRVRADSLGWLRKTPAEKRLNSELTILQTEGVDAASLARRRTEISDWMTHFNHQSDMYQWIGHTSDGFSQSFGLFVTARIEIGIRYCYQFEVIKE